MRQSWRDPALIGHHLGMGSNSALPYPQWDECALARLTCPDCGYPVTIPVFLDWDDQIRVAESFAGPFVDYHAQNSPSALCQPVAGP